MNDHPLIPNLSKQILERMEIKNQPFSQPVKKPFRYDGLQHMLEVIVHHLEFSSLVLLLHGEQGSGKTYFLHALADDLKEHEKLRLFTIQAEYGDDITKLRRKLNGIVPKPPKGATVEDTLNDMLQRNLQPVLAVVDTQCLDEEVIGELFNFVAQVSSGPESQVKLLLISNQDIAHQLEPFAKQHQIQTYSLQPPHLTEDETRKFLMHYLTAAGYKGKLPFTADEIRNITSQARGLPASILVIASHTLELGSYGNPIVVSRQEKPQIQLHWWLGGGAVAAMIVLILVFSLWLSSSEPTSDEDSAITDETIQTETPSAQAIPAPSEQLLETTKPAPATKPEGQVQEPQLGVTLNQLQIPDDLEQIESAASPPDSGDTVPEAPTQPVTQTQAPLQQDEKPAQSPEKAQQEEKPASPPVADMAGDSSLTQRFRDAGVFDSTWILNQNSDKWTLQMMAAYDPEELLKFVANNSLRQRYAYYRTTRQGKDWHVLLYGQYSSQKAAINGLNSLPKKSRWNKPWPRQMSAVHKAMQGTPQP